MGFNIKNNYGPNIEVNAGGKVTLVQGKNGLWNTADAEETEYEEVAEERQQPGLEDTEDNRGTVLLLHSSSCTQQKNRPSVTRNDADLIEKLKPIFYNNETDVRAFLKEIAGMKPGDITDLVNRWVQEKRISDYGSSRKGELWKILYDAKLYSRTIQNWNRRVY